MLSKAREVGSLWSKTLEDHRHGPTNQLKIHNDLVGEEGIDLLEFLVDILP